MAQGRKVAGKAAGRKAGVTNGEVISVQKPTAAASAAPENGGGTGAVQLLRVEKVDQAAWLIANGLSLHSAKRTPEPWSVDFMFEDTERARALLDEAIKPFSDLAAKTFLYIGHQRWLRTQTASRASLLSGPTSTNEHWVNKSDVAAWLLYTDTPYLGFRLTNEHGKQVVSYVFKDRRAVAEFQSPTRPDAKFFRVLTNIQHGLRAIRKVFERHNGN